MTTRFIPFAQMTHKQKKEHLVRAHGVPARLADVYARLTQLNSRHTTDHRTRPDDLPVAHEHTKVTRS